MTTRICKDIFSGEWLQRLLIVTKTSLMRRTCTHVAHVRSSFYSTIVIRSSSLPLSFVEWRVDDKAPLTDLSDEVGIELWCCSRAQRRAHGLGRLVGGGAARLASYIDIIGGAMLRRTSPPLTGNLHGYLYYRA